jgi:hypothetical protein
MTRRCSKKSYPNYGAAIQALDAVLASTTRAGHASEICAYECERCGRWHLTKVITFRPRGKGRGKAGRPRKGVA